VDRSTLTPRETAAQRVIRPLVPSDAEELAALYCANRDHLVPFVEIRDMTFFTAEGQRKRIERAAATAANGDGWRFAIVNSGLIAGTVGVTNVVRGPLQCAKLGYWVDRAQHGHGLATRAVDEVAAFAFEKAGLHRLEAWTLVDNVASQRVLEKNGFERFGLARALLLVDGEWRDHLLFERIAD
jgi:ribosomal-protein-alanine N-acetyltransferase